MSLTVIVVAWLFGQAPNVEMSGAQFDRTMQTLHSEIQDVEFVCEGSIRYIGPRSSLKVDPEIYSKDYQSVYAFRSKDGASNLDLYIRPHKGGVSGSRSTIASLNGKLGSITRLVDKKEIKKTERNGDCTMTNQLGNPQRMFYPWFFIVQRGSRDPMEFQFQGWETIEGRSCLRAQIAIDKDAIHKMGRSYRFWIDLQRGGHPLKVEYLIGDKVAARTTIQLKLVAPQRGQRDVWFPIRASHHSFQSGAKILADPIFEETYHLVDGSLRIDADLPDDRFKVDWNGDRSETDEVRRLRQASESFTPPAKAPTDPASLRKSLDQRLVEADRQASRLEASSPARDSWNGTLAAQVLFGVTGIALLTGAWFWRKR